jgi:hypothetical protein
MNNYDYSDPEYPRNLPEKTIEQLLSKPIHGDAYKDQTLMSDLNRFILTKRNSTTHKRQALQKLYELTGENKNANNYTLSLYVKELIDNGYKEILF